MKRKIRYVLNKEVSVIYPHYSDEGKLQSVVMEGNDLRLIDQSPAELIDDNLRFYGSSLRGAIDGTQMILGSVKMAPVMINPMLNLCYFPSKSPFHEECVWFAPSHIKRYLAIGKDRTSITFPNNAIFRVNISRYSFDGQYKKACMLRFLLDDRINQQVIYKTNQMSSMFIMKNADERNYRVLDEEE